MESNKKAKVPTSKNTGTHMQTAANTGISTAEKEKSFDDSGEHSEDLDNITRKDKPSNLSEGSEFVNDSNAGQKEPPFKNPAQLEDPLSKTYFPNSDEDSDDLQDPDRRKNKDSDDLQDPKREYKKPNPDSPDYGDNPLQRKQTFIPEDVEENMQSNK